MSGKPIANYTYGPSKEIVGYDAVGPGWRPILEVLDAVLESFHQHAVDNATVVKEEYRDKECQADATLRVVQVKEKFGGLRVYVESKGLGTRIWGLVQGAIQMAEGLSLRTCEKCGAPGAQHGAETRPTKRWRYGRVLTLCEEHRAEREVCREEQKPFELGNGDRTT